MKWVYAAYIVTWTVHIIYFVILTRGYQRVRREIQDLERR